MAPLPSIDLLNQVLDEHSLALPSIALEPASASSPPLAPKPEPTLGSALIDPVPVLPPDVVTGLGPVPRGPAPAAESSPVVYSKAKLQRLLTIYIYIKRASNNKHCSTLKTRFPNLYFGNFHLNCHRFCQHCEDHFNKTRARSDICTSFAALFLRDDINTC